MLFYITFNVILSNVQCYFTKTLLFRDMYCIVFVTSASIHFIMRVCHVLLKDLLTYLLI